MNACVVILLYYLLASLVRCKGENYVADENIEIEAESEDDDQITYDEKERKWVKDAIRNVAYYLRSHKFNGYDARFFKERPPPENRSLFGKFVEPPLKYFYFETFQNCKDDFTSCLRYLYETIVDAYSQRSIDTIYIMRKNNLTLIDNAEEIRNIDEECHRLKDLDDTKSDPFGDPVERFQWSMTASYYMCWFTLMEEPDLMHFGEPCNNFANCLQDGESTSNNDIRADDSVPFQCAMYSFCPDPCCSSKRLLLANDSCQLTDGNPCRSLNNPVCSFNKTLNRSFISVVYNEWNVSCVCQTDGYRWNSRYGQCIDHNECRYHNPCNMHTEECANVYGRFYCYCKLKYRWSSKEKKCVENDELIRAMKRFSGVDGSYCTRPNNLLYLVLGGLFWMECFMNKVWLF